MPVVETTLWIDAPVAEVVAIARDSERFPEFMSDVKSVTVVEREGDRTVTDWEGVVAAFGLKVRWRQEDVWDAPAGICRFRQLSGDYDKMDGTWHLVAQDGGTRFDSHVDYEYRVPGLGPLVAKVVHSLVVKNLDGMLSAFKERCEGPREA
jgi:uncharacterized membrane protein